MMDVERQDCDYAYWYCDNCCRNLSWEKGDHSMICDTCGRPAAWITGSIPPKLIKSLEAAGKLFDAKPVPSKNRMIHPPIVDCDD